jgi:cephalosporin hydroxylase
MRYSIDTEQQRIRVEGDGTVQSIDLFSEEGFGVLSRLWLTVGWSLKYSYQFSWLGRPIIQLPEDMVRIQELIYEVRPDVIIEIGIAHGGGQVFFASLCKLMGKGRVVGVDIEMRPHNRAALEAHELYPLITVVEGSSTEPAVVERVKAEIGAAERALVFLDSHHARDHVLGELEAYGPLVGVGSYVIVADGIMEEIVGAPRTRPEWARDNPKRAIAEFLTRHPEFKSMPPPRPFDEAMISQAVTYWPDGYLRRVG